MVQSELSAVNALLTSIGDTPISSLGVVHSDIESAKNIIESTSLDLQSESWYFNSETWDFHLDSDFKQPLPTNTLYVNTDNTNWIKRGSYLYELKSHSYSFEAEDISNSSYVLVTQLALSELPYLAYSLIVARAKIQFITELESDMTKVQVLSQQADYLYVQLKKLHLTFVEPNAMASPAAQRLLFGTPWAQGRRF